LPIYHVHGAWERKFARRFIGACGVWTLENYRAFAVLSKHPCVLRNIRDKMCLIPGQNNASGGILRVFAPTLHEV
jgi:hypothetical protein